jgi:two-component sensor histidine kinase
VDFSIYLEDLCAGVRASLIHDDRIELEVSSEPISIPVDMAVPLGMVVNELVTNAVKYAYPSAARGPIWVRFARSGSGLLLAVRDFGRGLPVNAGRPGGGLGMKLVRSLVAQVHGEISTAGPPGAAFEIRLPAPA